MHPRSRSEPNCLASLTTKERNNFAINEFPSNGDSNKESVYIKILDSLNRQQPQSSTSDTADGYWNGGNMKEVSSAIKQFINDTEEKETALNVHIELLRKKLEEKETQFAQFEKKIKERFQKEKQNILLEHQEEISALKRSLLQKDEDIKRAVKQQGNLHSQISTLKYERAQAYSNHQIAAANINEEYNKLKNIIHDKETQLEELGGKLNALHQKDNENKLLQSRLEKALIVKEQELVQKELLIEKLEKTTEEKSKEIMNLTSKQVDTDKVQESSEMQSLIYSEFSKLKEINDHKEKELLKANDEVQSAKEECRHLQENSDRFRKIASQLEHENKEIRSSLDQSTNKISQLTQQLNEAISNEENLEKKVQELSKQKISDELSEQFVESKILKASSKTESNLKKDIDIMKNEISKNNELCAQYYQENHALHARLKQMEVEHQDVLNNYQMTEDSMTQQIKNLTEKEDNFQHHLYNLNSKLKESADEIRSLQKINKTNSIEIENLQKEKISLVDECSVLSCENQAITAKLQKTVVEKSKLEQIEKQLKDTISHLRSKTLEVTASSKNLKGKIESMFRKEEHYRMQLKETNAKYEQVQNQNNKFRNGLLELQKFIEQAKEEVKRLRIENEQQLEKNQELLGKIELLTGKYTAELEQQNKWKVKIETLEKLLEKQETEFADLTKENGNLQNDLQKTIIAMNAIVKEKQDETKAMESLQISNTNTVQTLAQKTKECDLMKDKYKQLIESMEQLKEETLTNKQGLALSQRQEELLTKELKQLKTRNEDLIQKMEMLEKSNMEIIVRKNQEEEKCKCVMIDLKRMATAVEDLTKENSVRENHVAALRHEVEKKDIFVKDRDNNILELSNSNKGLQLKLKDLKEQLNNKEDELKKINVELQDVKAIHLDESDQLKEMKTQMRTATDCVEKVRQQNKQLKATLEDMQNKEKSYKSDAHTQHFSISDLQKKCEGHRKENEKLKSFVGNLKARVQEMQGMIAGTQHKHNWVTHNDQEQRHEIKELKEAITEFQSHVMAMKQQLFKAQFQNKKLTENLKTTNEHLEKSQTKLNDLQTRSKNREEELCAQITNFQQKVNELSKSENLLQHELKNITDEYEKMSKSSSETSCRNKHLEEQVQLMSGELATLQLEGKDLFQIQQATEGKNKKLQSDFVNLVMLLKRLKKDRDSFSTMLRMCEEENKRLTKRIQQLQLELSDVRSRLKCRQREEVKVLKDNKDLQATISTLKYTEALMSSENKDILEKLANAENKLKEFNLKESRNEVGSGMDDTHYAAQDIAVDNTRERLISELTNLLHCDVIERNDEINNQEEMKTFLDDVLRESSQEKIISSEKRRPKLKKRFVELNNRRRYKTSQKFHELYSNSRKIYTSLLADIKSLTDSFSQYDDIINNDI